MAAGPSLAAHAVLTRVRGTINLSSVSLDLALKLGSTADRDPAVSASFGIFSPETKRPAHVHVHEVF